MAINQGKRVDIMALEGFRMANDETGVADCIEKSTLVKGCDPELAKELVAAGRARLATEAESKAADKPAKG